MSVKLSSVYGMEIYTEDAKRLGKVEDIIIDLEEKRVWLLTLDRLNLDVLSRMPPERLLTQRGVSFEKVKGISDIVLVEASPLRRSV